MFTISSVSQSGMNAASGTLRVSANNIANINTDGFKKVTAIARDVRGGGVALEIAESSAHVIHGKPDVVDIAQPSNVSLVDESVNQIVARHQFTANVAVLKTSVKVGNEILDVLA